MKTIVIGVSGPSSSGKSTVALLLKKILPFCEIIHQDDFFKPEKMIPFDEARGDRDWDCPEAIDIDTLKETLSVLKDPKKYSTCPNAKVSKSTHSDSFIYSLISTEPPRDDSNFNVREEMLEELRELISKHDFKYKERVKYYLVDGFMLLPASELIDMFDFTLFFKTDYSTLKARRQDRSYTVDGNEWTDPPGYFDLFVWPGYYNSHKCLFSDGYDEDKVKLSGGLLKTEFKSRHNVHEFINDNNCEKETLLKLVVDVILSEI